MQLLKLSDLPKLKSINLVYFAKTKYSVDFEFLLEKSKFILYTYYEELDKLNVDKLLIDCKFNNLSMVIDLKKITSNADHYYPSEIELIEFNNTEFNDFSKLETDFEFIQ